MPSKDYYKILGVPRTSTSAEIKRAFRLLAKRYHPDKTGGKAVDAEKFLEVHEAYRVLSDTRRRTSYNQQWWYKNAGHATTGFEADTPEAMLYKSGRLHRYLDSVDNSAIDPDALFDYLNGLLSDHAVIQVSAAGDADRNRKIIDDMLHAIRLVNFNKTHPIILKLKQIAGGDEASVHHIEAARTRQKMDHYWRKYQWLLILLATLLLCLIIYAAGS